jgi:ABC-type transport system involved in multi-copper enzyme maturation permease subunit
MFHRFFSPTRSPLNPITVHELRALMRNPHAYSILTFYLSVISGIALLVYIAISTGGNSGVNDSSRVGSVLFYIIISMQIVLVCCIAPWYTSGAISGEREMNTYDLLRLTLLKPREIVMGKLLSAFGYTLLLVFATLPLLSLALLLGGVDISQMLAAVVVICATAFLFACLGLFVSSHKQTILGATTLTFALVLVIVVGSAVFALVVLPLLNSVLFDNSTIVKTSPFLASLIQVLQFIVVSFSPISTLVTSETNLQESGNLYTISVNPIPGTTMPFSIPAPFSITVMLYSVAGILLLWFTIQHLSRPDIRD